MANAMVFKKGRINKTDIRRKAIYEERIAKERDLRVAGMTLSDIVATIKKSFKAEDLPPLYGIPQVQKDLAVALRYETDESAERMRELRAIEAERLDNLFLVAYNAAIGGSMKSMYVALSIMERRAKMLGIDKPTTVQVKDWRSEVLALLTSGKVSIADVRNELGEELTRQVIESGGEGFIEGFYVEAKDDSPEGKLGGEDAPGLAGSSLALGLPEAAPISHGAEHGLGFDQKTDSNDSGNSGG
jgi:hypothetical protein